MNQQLKQFLKRLRKPSVIMSVVSQIITALLLLGFDVDKSLVMAIATIGCSILVTLGILSNPDSTKKGYTDNMLTCSNSGKKEKHIMINGQMVCTECGAVYDPSKDNKAAAS